MRQTFSKARSEVSGCVIFSRYPSQICWICDTDLQEVLLPNYCLSEVFLYISFAGTFPVFQFPSKTFFSFLCKDSFSGLFRRVFCLLSYICSFCVLRLIPLHCKKPSWIVNGLNVTWTWFLSCVSWQNARESAHDDIDRAGYFGRPRRCVIHFTAMTVWIVIRVHPMFEKPRFLSCESRLGTKALSTRSSLPFTNAPHERPHQDGSSLQ